MRNPQEIEHELWPGTEQPPGSFLANLRGHLGYLRGALVLALLAGGISLAQRNTEGVPSATARSSPTIQVPYLGFEPELVYDPKRQEIVLFNEAGQTWLWSKKNWTLMHPAVSPAGGCCSLAAWDPAIGEVLMVAWQATAGSVETRPLKPSQTWAWTGSNWVEIGYGLDAPPPDGVAMTYDERNGQMLLVVYNGNRLDTWTWAADGWRPRASPGGPSQPSFAMAYDRSLGTVLAVEEIGDTTAQTWSWDGSRWRRLSPASEPQGSAALSLADSATGLLLVTDTASLPRSPGDVSTWMWNGHDWGLRFVWQRLPLPAIAYGLAGGERKVWAFMDMTPSTTTCIAATAVWEWTVDRWTKMSELTGSSATRGCG
jgi:hypothetical protein